MKKDEQTQAVHRWLHYAQEDLQTAAELLKQAHVIPRHVCWLSQQAAEKSIKAALVFSQIDFPYSHDLDLLRNILPKTWQVKTKCFDLAELTEWAIESRYPGDWPDATVEDAQCALKQAESIYSLILEDII